MGGRGEGAGDDGASVSTDAVSTTLGASSAELGLEDESVDASVGTSFFKAAFFRKTGTLSLMAMSIEVDFLFVHPNFVIGRPRDVSFTMAACEMLASLLRMHRS